MSMVDQKDSRLFKFCLVIVDFYSEEIIQLMIKIVAMTTPNWLWMEL